MIDLRLLVGFVLPPVIDLVNVRIEDEKVKWAVSLGICVLVGIILNLDKLNWLDIGGLTASIAIIFTEANGLFNLYYKKSSVRNKILDRIA